MDKNTTVSQLIDEMLVEYTNVGGKYTKFKVMNTVAAGVSATGHQIIRKPSFASEGWGFGDLVLRLFDSPTYLAKFPELTGYDVDKLLGLLHHFQSFLFGGTGIAAGATHYSLDVQQEYIRYADDGSVSESGVIFDGKQ